MFPRILLWIIFINIFINVSASSDTILTTQLLNRIVQLQAKESSVFPKGIFPSYRIYALNKSREKADVNAFFTGLISFTLQDLKLKLTKSQQIMVDSIIARSNPVYEKFKNKKGGPTYNFWATDTVKVFPNSGLLNLFDKTQNLPDDLDDTVIFLLAMNTPDSNAKKVHSLMQSFTNNINPIKNTYKEYSKIQAYSTWFGVRMPVDFDLCVLTNILYFVQRYELNWTAADSASLQYIESVIRDNRHMSNASYVSPHYNKSSIILYHLSRLMSEKPITALEILRPKLIADAQNLLTHSTDFMEQCILQTSLIRWGVKPQEIVLESKLTLQELVENGYFSFFIANMGSTLPNPWKEMLGSKLGKFYYVCEAYNNLLLLENILLSKELN